MKKFSIILSLVSILIFSAGYTQDDVKKITLEDIWTNYKFYPKSVSGIKSMNNGEQYTMIKNGSIIVYNYKDGDSATSLIQSGPLKLKDSEKPIEIKSFEMSTDETKFLIPTETERIYRHSSKSLFYIWDTQTENLTPLSSGKQLLADFSPDGTKVAFVRENNIFIKDLATGIEKQITGDGKKNHIINVSCDWVYVEDFGLT